MYEHASVPRSCTVAQGMLTAHGKGPKSVLVCFHVFFFLQILCLCEMGFLAGR